MSPSNYNQSSLPPMAYDDPDWLEEVLATEARLEEEAGLGTNHSAILDSAPADPGLVPAAQLSDSTAATSAIIVLCPDIASIPPGRQPTANLMCGFPGCASVNLFSRKAELQRHMETHLPARFPCHVAGCDRVGANGFKRREHLRNHLRKIHGI
ncbi:hypothetical protein CLAFUW4_06037 [Fulvia fulva]|uniref:C2H2-type domain-containing protein n=1 Tax=Passalora fulva TaxID=5499 RepID=A0A9Q8P8W8_PASFU|nr:uncharacterized protein CLAFUR5_06181 [Fulvia fulva]KAK4624338.1 hypothetical protein CLAFUR4_06042 [Fulvia fulva]KAK4624931.1 hypothetical protein CLAFUR0_06045 [Fulvia fulva]UJO17639.1 hypothetical protein CLAFUR5_06181 [Fulvia fulva]WPV14428.1 hypothetical protein CLAFUW4_06037 [Fulvia fulva]WPV29485.1 hypothetical protein CLAFUW7_06035 [Fulvia fulva]